MFTRDWLAILLASLTGRIQPRGLPDVRWRQINIGQYVAPTSCTDLGRHSRESNARLRTRRSLSSSASSPATSLLPVRALVAQPQKPSYDPKRGQAPVWETAVPAPPLSPAPDALAEPAEPGDVLVDSGYPQGPPSACRAESAGRTIEPNTALHDFPYWTRTHSMFIYHSLGAGGEQHAAAHGIRAGGRGDGRIGHAGGRRPHPHAHVLTESGQQIPGELRGSSIDDGKTYRSRWATCSPFPRIRRAQFSSEAPGGLTYMVMKVNAMLYPWDLIR